MDESTLAPVLYIPHGGGPLPLMNHPGHSEVIAFLKSVSSLFPRPDAILIISAHWEESKFTIQDIPEQQLIYDYFGFPSECYEIEYPAPPANRMADRIASLLTEADIDFEVDRQRGSDHGMFVPLKLIYPDAAIPCLQVSLREDLDPAAHIQLGRALAPLRKENVLILGSGSSFHNTTGLRNGMAAGVKPSETFDKWLDENCCGEDVAAAADALINWRLAPEAEFAHPREEHLIPLHVCLGAALEAGKPAKRVFDGTLMGLRMSAFLWS